MNNRDMKRVKEIVARLREIRSECNSCRIHNTDPLSKERLLALYSEEGNLMSEYTELWVQL